MPRGAIVPKCRNALTRRRGTVAAGPGEVLLEDCLASLGMSVNALSVALGVPATRIHEVVKERRAVTADTAARLAKYFGGDAASWLVMLANDDLKTLPTRSEIERRVRVRGQLAAQR